MEIFSSDIFDHNSSHWDLVPAGQGGVGPKSQNSKEGKGRNIYFESGLKNRNPCVYLAWVDLNY